MSWLFRLLYQGLNACSSCIRVLAQRLVLLYIRFPIPMVLITQMLAVTTYLGHLPWLDQSTTGNAELERFWSYGRSRPVYPTPQGLGTGEWSEAYIKAGSLVSRMTNEEKNNITYGFSTTSNGCGGVSGSVPRLDFPGMCLQDAENGVRGTDMVNGYPAGLHVGASWNRKLAYDRGLHMGAEFKAKGASIALGPQAGPIGKIPRGGRNWEGFTNDPYLSGVLNYETIVSMQKSVITCIKHLLGNEQETSRMPPRFATNAHNQSVSSNIDEKTVFELYLWPFQDSIKAGAISAMCSYQRFNNSYSCQNSYLMNGLLKHELGFQGFVVSDWSGQYSGLASADSGLDMAMPKSPLWRGNLSLAVSNGSLAQSRLDDMATRIVASWYRLAEMGSPAFARPGFGIPYDLSEPHELVNARNPMAKSTIFQGAVEGHVLVKNKRSTLPLKSPKFVSLFGYDALSASINTFQTRNYQKWALGLENTLVYPDGTVLTDDRLHWMETSSLRADILGPGVSLNGTLISGGGSGAASPAYIDSPFDAFQRQAYEDNTFLAWDFTSFQPVVNKGSEHCVVFINELSAEGYDRPYLADTGSDLLVQHVASQCESTIVVIHNAGIRLVDAWIDNPNITAVIYAHLPGQDSGRALVEVMYGNQSPSGRLPYTVAKKESDYGHLLNPVLPVGADDFYTQDNFTEGLNIDYKHFLAHNITPLYPFGYGLTYTEFTYSNLTILDTDADRAPLVVVDPAKPIPQGGHEALWDVLATVHCTVTNVGHVAAAEVAQLYVHVAGGPPRMLRGFEKKMILPGQSEEFVFKLTRRDVSGWESDGRGWVLREEPIEVFVGKSVVDVQLQGRLMI